MHSTRAKAYDGQSPSVSTRHARPTATIESRNVLAKSKLIKDTTRAEREEIIKLALAGCGNGSCDNCGSCSLGAGDPYGTYQPYIDGELEIADINMMVAERNAKLFGLQCG